MHTGGMWRRKGKPVPRSNPRASLACSGHEDSYSNSTPVQFSSCKRCRESRVSRLTHPLPPGSRERTRSGEVRLLFSPVNFSALPPWRGVSLGERTEPWDRTYVPVGQNASPRAAPPAQGNLAEVWTALQDSTERRDDSIKTATDTDRQNRVPHQIHTNEFQMYKKSL